MDISLLVALLCIVFTLYYVMFYIPRVYKQDVGRKIGNLAWQQRKMDQLREKTNIQRILILKSHNGSGVPRPGYNIKVTALYESYEAPFKNVVEDYKNLTVDGKYILMLEDVKLYGYTAFFTANMEECLLKRIYEQEGVLWSYVFYIGRDLNNWYYGSLATSKPQSPFKEGHGLLIELFINDIRESHKRLMDSPLNRVKSFFRIP